MKYNLTKSMGSLIATAETESATRALTSKTARATRTTKTAVTTKTQQQMPPRNCKSLKANGFTIIEVALVLAIAGLIFLVVFLALPALQNSQKDTARKQDVGRVVSALQSYMADNNGSLDSLTTSGGGELYYSSNGSTTSGFSGYVGKLSQHSKVSVRGDSNGDDELNTGIINYIQGNNMFEYVFVSVGEACLSGTSGGGTSTDASVYALLSNGTVYCASM